MSRILTVKKRDGGEENFDESRISDSIFRAASSAGEGDREVAAELAGVVSLFLEKRSQSPQVHVGEIEDMVERVLLETGRVETARAYIKMRGEGGSSSVSEGGPRPGELFPGLGISVVSSDAGALSAWDRSKITAALMREARLSREEAGEIAAQVESRIAGRGLTRISSALVRSLVDAEMFDRGLTDEIGMQAMLGMPAYDFKELVLPGSKGTAASPEEAVRMLAGKSMRQFAFGEVFSGDTAHAHADAEIHVESASAPVHLSEAFVSLEYLKRFGAFPFTGGWEPPSSIDGIASGISAFAEGMRDYFSSGLDLGYVNLSMAPCVEEGGEAAMEAAGVKILDAVLSASDRRGSFRTALNISAGVPDLLRFTEARGLEGRKTGRGFAEYWTAAERFSKALVSAAAGARTASRNLAEITIHVDSNTFKNPSALSFLRFACRHIGPSFAPGFVFEHEPSWMNLHSRLLARTEDPELFRNPERMRVPLVQSVAINAVRAALAAGHGNIDRFCSILESSVSKALNALREKKEFVAKLSRAGVFAGIEAGAPDSEPVFRIENGIFSISLTGISEAAGVLAGRGDDLDTEALKLALSAISFLMLQAREQAKKMSIPLIFGGETSPEGSRRFASADKDAYPSAEPVRGAYSAGLTACAKQVHEMHEAVRDLGSRFSLVEWRLFLSGLLENPDNPPEGFFDLVCDVFENTDIVYLRFK